MLLRPTLIRELLGGKDLNYAFAHAGEGRSVLNVVGKTADDLPRNGVRNSFIKAVGEANTTEFSSRADKFKVDVKNYSFNAEVYNNPKYFDQETGKENWPSNGGAVKGTEKTNQTIPENKTLVRWGKNTGSFFTEEGIAPEQLSMSPRTDLSQHTEYRTLKPIQGVKTGTASPWFDRPGGGWQAEAPMNAKEMIRQGLIEEVIK